MKHLGHTRSSFERDHFLITPDTFVRAPLPGMHKATAIVHAAPGMGARFTQYTVEFEKEGVLGPARAQRFIYVLEGKLRAGKPGPTRDLSPGSYLYIPPGEELELRALKTTRAAVIEKPRVQSKDAPANFPGPVSGEERNQKAIAFLGDNAVHARQLLPETPEFDFAVNTMTFQPGATLPMVEAHVMEHGLLMLTGEGIYRLGDKWYPVTAGDFIWMAPYCPQWFGALGKTETKYLIYKDWNRHPLD
ncbi:MAG TPA: (S)-ureidoglycine aminohydrolase [Bryobacteraceae bacterium]|jgi:(S)-ureidoglycine aminohydrolase